MQDTLGLEEAAELLKVNAETVRRLADSGSLMGAKIGVSWVFIKADLIEYLRGETRRQTGERRERYERPPEQKIQRVKTGASAAGVGRRRRPLPSLEAMDHANHHN